VRMLAIGLAGVLAALAFPGQLTSDQAHLARTGVIAPSCQVRVPEVAGPFPSLLDTELPDGTLVLGGSYTRGHDLVAVLHAVLPDCQAAQGFGLHGRSTVTLAVASPSAKIDVIEATGDGEVLLGGGAGADVIVGRLLPDGHLDPSFGTSGLSRLPSPARPAKGTSSGTAVGSLALGPSGTVYVGGNDGAAHCCVEDFVGALSPSGRLERSFGHGGWAMVPALDGSYDTEVFTEDGGLLVMGFVMYTGCGGPVLVRLGPGGKPDEAFAAAARQSIAAASPRYDLLGPALYPRRDGGFALVGDLLASDCQLPAPKTAGGGLAVGFLADGRTDHSFGTDGKTELPSDGSSGTWAVPLLGGTAAIVTERVAEGPTYDVPRSLKVRELSSTGRFDRAFGLSGTRTIGLSWASAPNSYPAVDATAGLDGSAVIVVAAKQRADIYRVAP